MPWLFVTAQGLQHNWHLCVVAQNNVAHVLPSLTGVAADVARCVTCLPQSSDFLSHLPMEALAASQTLN